MYCTVFTLSPHRAPMGAIYKNNYKSYFGKDFKERHEYDPAHKHGNGGRRPCHRAVVPSRIR